MAEISDVVRVSSSFQAGGLARKVFGRGLFLTTDDSILSAGGPGKVRTYSRMRDIESDFVAGTEPRSAAQAWFAQVPRPKDLLIGRWARSAVNTTITGGTPAAVNTLSAISDGSFRAGDADYSGLDLSGATTFAAIAGRVQGILQGGRITGVTIGTAGAGYRTGVIRVAIGAPPSGGTQATATATQSAGAITAVTITNPGSGYTSAPTITITNSSGAAASGAAGVTATVSDINPDTRFAGATVSYATGRFEVVLPSKADIGGPFGLHSQGTGSDLSEPLGLGTTATYRAGSDPESVSEALAAIEMLDNSFYFVGIERDFHGTQTMRDVAAWVATRRYMHAAASAESEMLTTGETTSMGALLADSEYGRSFGSYRKTADYLNMSIAARMSAVNFAAPNSLITAKFKTCPGFSADTFTPTELSELRRKRWNYYTKFSGDAIYAEGETFADGGWIDVQYGLDWLTDAVEINVWNLLRRAGKVPQTDVGLMSIRAEIEQAMEEAVTNGLIAPGTVSADIVADIQTATGNVDFDGELTSGYLVHVGSLAAQSQTDRESRISPAWVVWAKGSGAIHEIDIEIRYNS